MCWETATSKKKRKKKKKKKKKNPKLIPNAKIILAQAKSCRLENKKGKSASFRPFFQPL